MLVLFLRDLKFGQILYFHIGNFSSYPLGFRKISAFLRFLPTLLSHTLNKEQAVLKNIKL